MLKLTDKQTGKPVWINPAQVAALSHPRQNGHTEQTGSLVMLAGGFELRIEERPEDVSAQLDKRLNAY